MSEIKNNYYYYYINKVIIKFIRYDLPIFNYNVINFKYIAVKQFCLFQVDSQDNLFQ